MNCLSFAKPVKRMPCTVALQTPHNTKVFFFFGQNTDKAHELMVYDKKAPLKFQNYYITPLYFEKK